MTVAESTKSQPSALYAQNHTLGIFLSCAGYSAWVIGDALIKFAGATLPILEILTITYFVSSVFTVLLAAFHGGVAQLRTKRPGFHLWRSILIMGATYGSFAGVIYLTLADFYTVIFTSPLILTVLAHFILKEKAQRDIWLAIIFGFTGVVIAVQFSNASGHHFSWQGVLATMLASFSLALTMLTARAAGHENNYSLTLWPQVICGIVSAIGMIILHALAIDPIAITCAVISGITGAIGLVLTNASLRVAPVAVVSPYHYIQIVGGAVIGYLVWHHVPAISVAVGAVMIIASGVYILHAEQTRKKNALQQ